MRRFVCFLLCCLLSLSLMGCQNADTPSLLKPVEFFYPQNTFSYTDTDTIFGSEHRESAGHEEDLVYLMDLYFGGPQSETLLQPFPQDCTTVSVTKKNDAVFLTVSDNFSSLTGMKLTVACVCLAKTVTGITGFHTVTIQTQTQLLDGRKSITVQNGKPVVLDDYIAPVHAD
ncbi:MAG: hypothetical protein IJA45_06905 [Oscillospiraceae bacterium]|nr:hypothetical protein [Oscillospiraceae bacterium]